MASYRLPFTFEEGVPDTVVARCKEVESGARNIDAILSRSLLPELSGLILSRLAEGKDISRVHVGTEPATGEFRYELG